LAASLAQLIAPRLMPNADTVYYTAAIITRIDAFTITNPSGSPVTVTLHMVPSGGAVADSNAIVKSRVVNTLESFVVGQILGQIMNIGDLISCIAGTNNALNIYASGLQFSG
jgi:hypothetical protein